MSPVRVLLIDDHALFRSGVAGLLASQADFEVVGEASNGQEGLERLHRVGGASRGLQALDD